MSVYATEEGDLLVDSSRYPNEIAAFLLAEKNIIQHHLRGHSVLVEVGCMQARNINIAIENHVKYIGIDIVPRYIKQAIKKINNLGLDTNIFKAIVGDALDLTAVLHGQDVNNALLVLPFNAFGNINNPIKLINSLAKLKQDVLISTYSTSKETDKIREKYYSNCGYPALKLITTTNDHSFVSSNGFESHVYTKEFIKQQFAVVGYSVEVMEFAGIGRGYFCKPK